MPELELIGQEPPADELDFHRKEWTIERVGWFLIALLVVAGLLGLLGRSGPLADAQVRTADGRVWLEYNRLTHRDTSARLHYTVDPALVQNGAVQVWLGGDFFHEAQVEQVSPTPASMVTEGDTVVLTFEVRSPTAPLQFFIHYSITPPGTLKGQTGVVGAGPLEFTTLVYP